MKKMLRSKIGIVVFLAVSAINASADDPYAKAVVFAHILNGNVGNSQTNVNEALGAPDDVYVSLGGPGASLIVDMGADTPVVDGPGADLEVREIGAASGSGKDESYRVLISNSTDTNTFVFVGQGRALSLIDIHSSGLESARYVWLQDLATETLGNLTPGSDIDSLRTLYYSGSGNDVAPPTAVSVRLTGQGAWLSWTASTATNVTGYAIRCSSDGVAYNSTADFTLSAQETAWHDLNLLVVSNLYYAVSTIAGSSESSLVPVIVSPTQLAVLTNQVVHLGDSSEPSWEEPSPQQNLLLTFTLPTFAEGPLAELTLDLFEVNHSKNAILLNNAKIAAVPSQSAGSWAAKSVSFAAGALQPGLNTLMLSAHDSTGGTAGNLDDFQVRNIWLRFYGTQTNTEIITNARFTEIAAGETTVTLRWVVDQTPSLNPADWQTVSDPIEWNGTLTPTNGFFRLQAVP